MDPKSLQEALVWVRQNLEEYGKPVPIEAFSGYVAMCPQTVEKFDINFLPVVPGDTKHSQAA